MTLAADVSPFVGPRPYELADRDNFFGRAREIADLCALTIANKSVLLHSRSGAGKSSLLRAGVLPRLAEAGMQLAAVTRPTLDNLADVQLRTPDATAPSVVVVDQFEELFTSKTLDAQRFFDSIARIAELNHGMRFLFAMREEWIADADEWSDYIPGRLRARYRVGRLGKDAAIEAIEMPFRVRAIAFAPDVLPTLIGNLTDTDQTVDPVQLQVVCSTLFRAVHGRTSVIGRDDLRQFGDVSNSLSSFYEQCLADARTLVGAKVTDVRGWFDDDLTTSDNMRGISKRGPETTAGVPNRVVDFLDERHLIRSEVRDRERYYELSHERLIAPVRQANEAWRFRRSARRATVRTATVLTIVGLLLFWATRAERAKQAADEARRIALASKLVLIASETVESGRDDDLALALLMRASVLNPSEPLLGTALHKILREPYLVRLVSTSSKEVSAVAWSFDGRLLAAIGQSSKLWLTVPEQQSVPREIACLGGVCSAISWAPDRLVLALGSDSGVVSLVIVSDSGTISSSALVAESGSRRSEISALAWHPSGQSLVFGTEAGEVYAVDDADTHPKRRLVTRRPSHISALAFNARGELAIASLDRTVSIVDASLEDARVLKTLKSPVTAVAWSNADELAVGSWDNTVRIWKDGEMIRLFNHGVRVNSVAWSPDGRLASGGADQRVVLWSLTDGSRTSLTGTGGAVSSLAWNAAGLLAQTGADGSVRIWSRNGARGGDVFRGFEHVVTSIASFGTNAVTVGTGDGTLRLWRQRPPEPEPLVLPSPTLPLRFSMMLRDTHGDTLVVAGGSHIERGGTAQVCVWSLATAGLRRRFFRPTKCESVRGELLAIAHDTARDELLIGDREGRVLRQDLARIGRKQAPFAIDTVLDEPVHSIAVVDSSTYRVIGASGVAATVIRSTTSVQRDDRLQCSGAAVGVLSSRGRSRAVACGNQIRWLRNDSLTTIDSMQLAKEQEVTALAFSPDGAALVYGTQTGFVGTWCKNGPSRPFPCSAVRAHTGGVRALHWIRGGQILLSGGSDNAVRSWNMPQDFDVDPCKLLVHDIDENMWRGIAGADAPRIAVCQKGSVSEKPGAG